MKAAAFDYVRATSIAEVCRLLAEHGPDAQVIAGGQTLVPLMAMRLARPELLIDINHIDELQGIELSDNDNTLIIRAGTRQAQVLSSARVQKHLPLLAEAITYVGHGQTRNRGTVGGSLANADPTAEIGLVVCVLDAVLVVRSSRSERQIAAQDFFVAAMETTLQAQECLVEVRFPLWRERGVGHGFHELGIRHGDFAIAAAAVQLALDSTGICSKIALAVGGASPTPKRFHVIETALVGTGLDEHMVQQKIQNIGTQLEPHDDVHASAEQRRCAAVTLAYRAILSARDRAGESLL